MPTLRRLHPPTALALLAALSFSACADASPRLPPEVTDVLDLPDVPLDYDAPLSGSFDTAFVRGQDNTPADNPITDAGATLGRVLFYDTLLSLNQTVSCATCHLQANAFAEPTAVSTGFGGEHTTRNAMGLANARFYGPGSFFWDERAETLEAQVLMPIENPLEMGLDLEVLVDRIEESAYYPPLFEAAFGDSSVSTERIARALAQFVRAIVSNRAPFDEGVAVTGSVVAPFPNYTAAQNLGKQVFFRGGAGTPSCAGCHMPGANPGGGNTALFFMARARNNGLDLETGIDDGVGAITGVPLDLGLFKSPELRNAALTAPYMHDGRLATLEDVVAHYRTGVEAHPNLDRDFIVPGTVPAEVVRFTMTDDEATALVAFLGTLTDVPLTEDVRFSDPFRAH